MRGWQITTRNFLAGTALLCLAGASVRADGPATRPALEELNREVRALYGAAQTGLIRVQVPQPQWLNDYVGDPLNKYRQIDRATAQRLVDQMRANAMNQAAQNQAGQNQAAQNQAGQNQAGQSPSVYSNISQAGQSQNNFINIQPGSATQPSTTQPATIIVVSPPAQQANAPPDGPGGQLQMNALRQAEFSPTYVGLVLDDQGHVLVPIYVERETCAAQPIRLVQPDGQMVEAKFIGSDRQTNLTIVEVAGAAGKAMPLGERIDAGSVCLFVSPVDGSARLGVWTGGNGDWGYVLATDGHVAGVARGGHLLSGSACKLIAGEIERFGIVRRPTLGVAVRQMVMVDAAKNQRIVMQVENVLPGSPAQKAGLHPGDVLLSVRGEPVYDISSLAAAMAACDGKTELQVLRNDNSMTLSAELTLPNVNPAAVK
jgi:S1-C subfamily serine protease